MAAQICDETFSLSVLNEFPENVIDDSVFNVIRDISPGFDDSLVACGFRGSFSTCFKYFHELLTQEGRCFTYNSLTQDEIRTE